MAVEARRRLCLEEGSRRGVRPQELEAALLHAAAAGSLLMATHPEGGEDHPEETSGAGIEDAAAAQGRLRTPSYHE